MFSSRLPLPALVEHCRATRHLLGAGLTLPKVMQQQAAKGPPPVRPVADRMAEKLARGEDFQSALEDEEKYFPPLYVGLCTVAEDTGRLVEMLGELEDYFTLLHKLRRDFISQIFWPVLQFIIAILIITGLIYILGVIQQMRGPNPISVMGLKGGADAVKFLGGVAGFFAVLFVLYKASGRIGRNRAAIHRFFLKLPVVGPCLESFALSRFALAMHVTMEAGIRIREALRLSLDATGNPAFRDATADVQASVRTGKELSVALAKTGLFSEEFLLILENAEETGQVPEVMKRQAKKCFEDASIRLKYLTRVTGGMIYAMVAIFIIIMIFSLWGQYFAALGGV